MRKRRKIKFSLPTMVVVFAIITIVAGIISNVSADEEMQPYTKYSTNILGVPGDFCVFCYGDASVSEVTADIAVGGDFLKGAFGNYETNWNFYKTNNLRHVNLNSYIGGEFKSNTFYNWQAARTKEELTTDDGVIKGVYDVGNKNGKGTVYLNKEKNTFSTVGNQTTINAVPVNNALRTDEGSDEPYNSYNVVGVDSNFIDFDKEFDNLQTVSTKLMNQPNQPVLDCIPGENATESHTYTYKFPDDKDVMVVKVDPEVFFDSNIMDTFNIDNFSSGKKLVINIDCKEIVTNSEGKRATPKIKVNGSATDWNILAEDIVFNFYSDTLILDKELETKETIGTILAPNLNIYVNGNLDGAVIARQVTAQEAIYGINLNISWADLEDELETIEIPVTKVWEDNNNSDGLRPASVTIGVYNGSTEVDRITLSADESWTGKSKELPKYDGDTEINYTVKELTTVGSYVASDPTGDKTNGYTITNTHTPGTTTVKVTKDWQDSNNKDNLRPESIKINVKKENDVVDTITLTEARNWTGISKELPQIEGGTEIQYSVEEQDVPNGYQMQDIKGDYKEGFTITNYHKPNDPLPGYVEFSVTKKWEDSDNAEGDRPDKVTVRVYKNGEEIEAKDLKEDDGWIASFRFAEGESDDIYTVKEDQVNKYQAKVEGDAQTGFTITNTYIEQVKTGIINVNINKFEENTTTSLEGAKFKAIIVDSVGKEVYNKEVTTDKNGNISLANIELDLDKDYTLTIEETDAPSGYNKSEEKVKVSVKLTKDENGIEVEATSENKNVSINGNEITVKFEDEKIKEEPPKEEPAKEEPPVTVKEKEEQKSPTILPQTGSNTGVIIAIIIASVIISRIIYVRFKKNNFKDK